MLNIILFIISFCLVVSSSYFFTAVFKSKRPENSVIFFLLNTAAQIILTFEFLSLLKAIDLYNVLKVNVFVFLFALVFWNIKNKPKLDNCHSEPAKQAWESQDLTNNEIAASRLKPFLAMTNYNFKTIKTELKKDKILFALSIFFLGSLIVSFFLAAYAPVNLWDSMTYHTARVAFWIQNKSLEHFETSSIRQVMFPPNAEIFYLWPLVFIKKDFLAGMAQFISFLGSLWVLTSFLTYIKISKKRILWAVFIFASLPEIILQASSTQNDLVLGFFLFASLYLFIYGVREKEKISIIMSAMALGISMGIKGSVFMFLPALGIIYTIISVRNEKKQSLLSLLLCGSWTVLFFLLLSSYNYILNYQEFHNPLGLKSYMDFYMPPDKSIQSFIANIIRYNLAFIDFTGFEAAKILSLPFLFLKTFLFKIFMLNEHQGLLYMDINLLNTKIHENFATFGPLGFLLFIPLVLKYGFAGVFSKSDKIRIISITALILLLFLPTISALYGFALWNIRYFVTAMVISSPLFALSYNYKLKPLKLIVFIIAVACFINISLLNSLRPILPINKMSLLNTPREDIRYEIGTAFDDIFRQQAEYLGQNAKNNSKIGLLFSDSFWYYQFFNENPTWKIFPLRYELLTKEKLENLDYIVICNNRQIFYNFDKSKNLLTNNKIDFKMFKAFELVYKVETPYNLHPPLEKKYEFENPVSFYIFRNKSSL